MMPDLHTVYSPRQGLFLVFLDGTEYGILRKILVYLSVESVCYLLLTVSFNETPDYNREILCEL